MDATMDFAYSELNRYHKILNSDFTHQIRLCISDDFIDDKRSCNFDLDDAFTIDIENAEGMICGVNARSVLLGVYRYFVLLGCLFYSPGSGGERIALRKREECRVHCTGIPSYRHRGICIEGAVSVENVKDIVDWLPKNGFNSYFIQFREGHNFFDRWYTHSNNTVLKPREYSIETSRRYVAEIEAEIKKRGLLYHKVGHGWTCDCLGYPSNGWYEVDSGNIQDGTRKYLAEIFGKRGFHGSIPLNTHLCYSNHEARELVVNEVVKYADENLGVDILHFWLADDTNNVCECAECRKSSLTDFYVMMMNDIDRILTEKGKNTKIVFLIYNELLWPPQHERIHHPERFVLMFAPISRSYTHSYAENDKRPDLHELPIEYRLNKVKYPKSISPYLAMLFRWQQHFDGDSFDFDYHLMWDTHRDFSGLEMARIIHSDVQSLNTMGLNGLISCQVNRAFFPTGFCMYVMGKTLWDSSSDFDELKTGYFSMAYGEEYELALGFLSEISKRIPFSYCTKEMGEADALSIARGFGECERYIEDALTDIAEIYVKQKGTCTERAWKNLYYCAEFNRKIVRILILREAGLTAEAQESVKLFKEFASVLEPELQSDIDLHFYFEILDTIVSAD